MKKCIKITSVTAMILILLQLFVFNVSAIETFAEDAKIDTIEIIRDECLYKQDKLMIPFRTFWKTFGATVEWDNEKKIANVFYKSESCEFEINVYMSEKPPIKEMWGNIKADMTVTVDGNVYPVFFNTSAEIIENMLYISSDVLTETFNAVMIYDWHKISIRFTEDNILNMVQREAERTEIIRLINEARVENGSNPLKQVLLLNEVSRIKDHDKSELKYSGHWSPILGAPAEMFEKRTNILRFTGE